MISSTSTDSSAAPARSAGTRKDRFTSQERSWILYDWANSVYATIIMAAVFPIYFANIAKAAGVQGDVLWGYASSGATLLIALAAPFLGAIGDFHGMKKKLFTGFMLLGVIFTASMGLTDNYRLMLAGYMLSYIGFAGSLLFYDSFLTDITEPQRMDRVSAYGYAMGYLGGSTIPFVISIALIMFGSKIGINGTQAVKISCIMGSLWWFGFSIPMVRNVRQTHYEAMPARALVVNALTNLRHTVNEILHNKAILTFMVAYFFYIDGVNTVIHMATVYGSTLGLGATGMILALLVTQIVAVPCSILFSRLSRRAGSIRMITVAICVYFFICAVGFYMGFSVEQPQEDYAQRYSQAFTDASRLPVAQPLSELSRDRYDTQVAELKRSGRGVLASKTRAADFKVLVDDQVAQVAVLYPAATDQATVRASLAGIGARMGEFLGSTQAAADYDRALARAGMLFWAMAALVGSVQGGIQAISRSFFGKLVPPNRSSEFFGFFDIFGKFAAVIGPALYAFSGDLTGRASIGILSLMILFAAGLVVMAAGRRNLAEAEAHGRRAEEAG